MGTDTRVDQGEEFAADLAELGDSQRSDVTFVMHVSADRSRATVVSLPRDLLVGIPACERGDGSMTRPLTLEMFNEAFGLGGPACTIRTVEKLTGLYLDHFALVDFQGFTRIVDAVGGVDVCLPEPVKDKWTGLNLPAGVTTVDGEQALAFVRARKFDPTQDIGRIQRQQAFLSSMLPVCEARPVANDSSDHHG